MSQSTPAKWKIEREKKSYRRELEADCRLKSTMSRRIAQQIAYLEMVEDGEMTLDGQQI